MNRRKFLAITGGGVVLAAGGTFGVVATRRPDKALAAWKQAGTLYNEPRKRALSYAILAPNPHNRQPWLIDLSHPDRVTLMVDLKRLLPHTDPFHRQITIGLGCFLELMRIAAAEDGYRVELDLFPDGDDPQALDKRPIAVATFVKDTTIARDPLFRHALDRRSIKDPYDLERPVSSDTLDRITSAAIGGHGVSAVNGVKQVATLREITHDAMLLELLTPRTHKESVDLFRIGKAEIEANPDGIDFSGPLFETLNFVGAMTREGVLDTTSSQFAQGKAAVLANTDTAMAHLWQVTADNTRTAQLHAGRDWLRIHLAATREGVAMQPLSQALQEYPEMKSLYDRTHKLLAPEGGTVQMLARLGYASAVPQSPRWPLSAKIVKD